MREYTIIIEKSDRILYLATEDKKIIAVNFMQGAGDLEYFAEWKKNDPELLKFVLKMWEYPLYRDMDNLDKIDEILWLHCYLDQNE